MERAPLFPIEEGPWRLAMALRPLDPADWLRPDDEIERDLAEKDRLIAERLDEVFAETSGSETACAELLASLLNHLPMHHPDRYRRDGHTMRVGLHRVIPLDSAESPLLTAGRLVQEDFCILQTVPEGSYHLTAATLCFPTRWRLHDKLGRPLAAIHDPVPAYADKLAKPVDRFFQHLKPGKPVWRINWSLLDDPALFQPTGHGRTLADLSITSENIGEKVTFRSERQTLVRLPETGAIVFGIRNYRAPLRDIASDSVRARRMLTAIETMPPDMLRYKSFAVFQGPLLAYLRQASAGAERH
jgi:dimethylamine monooxygenase subunit A